MALVVNYLGENIKELDLGNDNMKVSLPLVKLNVDSYLQRGRSNSARAKTRAEVSGGGAKPWKQKGTGRARAGSNTSPLWHGGGVIFPPQERNYFNKMNKKSKGLALKSALSLKMADIMFLESFLELQSGKTKSIKIFMDNIKAKSILFVVLDWDDKLAQGLGNLRMAKVVTSGALNVYDILKYHKIIFLGDIEKTKELL